MDIINFVKQMRTSNLQTLNLQSFNKAILYMANTPPDNVLNMDIWFDSSKNKINVFLDGEWREISSWTL